MMFMFFEKFPIAMTNALPDEALSQSEGGRNDQLHNCIFCVFCVFPFAPRMRFAFLRPILLAVIRQ
jgi:hypothetical protein